MDTIILLVIYVVIIYIPVKNNFLDRINTENAKAIATIAIIFRHLINESKQIEFSRFFISNGFLFVGMFFLISGYGLTKKMESKTCARKDILNILGNRFLKLGIPYLFVTIIMGFDRFFIFKNSLSWNFLSADTFIPYDWYIYTVSLFYIVHAVFFLLVKKKNWVVDWVIVAIYVFICSITTGVNCCWYMSAAGFALGATFTSDKLIKMKDDRIWIFILTIGFLLSLKQYNYPEIRSCVLQNFTVVFFAPLFLMLCSRLGENKLLKFINRISYEMYLLQAFCKHLIVNVLHVDKDVYICLGVLLLDILFSYILHGIDEKVINYIKSRFKLC